MPRITLHDPLDQFEITAHPQNAGLARERVRDAARRVGFAAVDLADIEIAVGEAVTNAILYGSPRAESRVVVAYGTVGPDFVIKIQDEGSGFDPTVEKMEMEEDTDALGGRGIRLMRALMDQVDLHYDGRGMVACLYKKLPDQAP